MSENKTTVGFSMGIAATGILAIIGLIIAVMANNKTNNNNNSDTHGNNITNPTFTTVVSGALSTEVLNIVKPSARNGVAESTTVYTLPTVAGKAGQVITLGADAKKSIWSSSGSVSGPSTSTSNGLAMFNDVSGSVLKSSNVTMDDDDGLAGVTSITGKNNTISIGKSAASKTAVDHFTSKERFEWVLISGDTDYQATLEPYQKMVPTSNTTITMNVPTTADVGTVITFFNAGTVGVTLTVLALDLVSPITGNVTISAGYSQDFVCVSAQQKGWSPVLDVTTGNGNVTGPTVGTENTIATYVNSTELKDTAVTIINGAFAEVLSITNKVSNDSITITTILSNVQDSGSIILETGENNGSGASGSIDMTTGVTNLSTSGSVNVVTGNSNSGSGGLTLQSGTTTSINFDSGDINIESGENTGAGSNGGSGNINIKSGNSAGGDSGSILIEAGSAGSFNGDITVGNNINRSDVRINASSLIFPSTYETIAATATISNTHGPMYLADPGEACTLTLPLLTKPGQILYVVNVSTSSTITIDASSMRSGTSVTVLPDTATQLISAPADGSDGLSWVQIVG
jgi:hypothetical protein